MMMSTFSLCNPKQKLLQHPKKMLPGERAPTNSQTNLNSTSISIYKYGNFSTSVGLIQEKNPAESHDNPYIGLPVPLEDHELLEKEFDVQTFCISFHPIHKELAIVSPVAYDLAGEKVIKSSDRIFMKISKQNNDLDYINIIGKMRSILIFPPIL